MKLNNHELTSTIILFIPIACHAFDESKFGLEKETMWRNMLSFTKSDQTIFLDIDNASNVVFKDSVLKSLHSHDHSVILMSEVPEPNFKDKLLALEQFPNIVFTTKYLNINILDDLLLTSMLKSPWSALFIIATIEDSFYHCNLGKLYEEAMNNIEQFLNDLWHKHRVMHVFLNLPYVCPNEYVVYDDTKLTDGELYNRTIKLVRTEEELSESRSLKTSRMLTQNYPLRGNIFKRFPTAIKDCKGTDIYIKTSHKHSGGFCGMDGLVMSDVVTHFGFNLSLPTFGPSSNKYGYQQPDGVITGSLGHIARGDVDFSFNSRFMTKYTTDKNYIYIYYVSHDALCAILKQPDEEPLWMYPINSYSPTQWIFILTCLASIGMLMWIFAKIINKMHNTKAATLLSYILNSVNAGLFGFFFSRRNNLLPLRVGCLCASIMILAEYQGYVNYIFTTRVRYDVLNSLADLAESGTVIQTSPPIYVFINESINDVGATILSRTLLMEDTDSFKYVLNHINTATLERQSDAIMLILMQYTDDARKPMLYVMNDCFRFFYLSYIANLEFPFFGMIHAFMMRLVESGLTKMYYTWTSRSLRLEVTLPSLYSEPRPASKIRMQEQVIAFSVLLVGYALSVITFVVEIGLFKRQNHLLYIKSCR